MNQTLTEFLQWLVKNEAALKTRKVSETRGYELTLFTPEVKATLKVSEREVDLGRGCILTEVINQLQTLVER